MATFAFGPVPDESRLFGKRRNVISSNASRTTNPAARRPRNQCLYQCTSGTRGATATLESAARPLFSQHTSHRGACGKTQVVRQSFRLKPEPTNCGVVYGRACGGGGGRWPNGAHVGGRAGAGRRRW